MPQLFQRRSNTIAKLSLIVIFLTPLVVFFVFAVTIRSPYETEVDVALSQPIPFSHEHHVGDLDIDCRFCHSFVENSHIAGMPSSKTCMTCHSEIWKEAPMLKPLRESFASLNPIAWNQVNRIPRFVYFNHNIHIKKGIGCSSCHGEIDRMPLTKKSRTFFMSDCLTCHRNPELFLRPSNQIYNPSYIKPDDQIIIGEKLLEKFGTHKKHLTDCYSCHR